MANLAATTSLSAGTGVSPILSIQFATIAFSGADSTKTATITTVDTSNATLHLLGQSNDAASNEARWSAIRVALTDSTTITATRNAATGTVTVGVMVIVWKSGVLASAVQRGTISISGGSISGTATITSVSTTRTCVSYLGASSNESGGFNISNGTGRVSLTSATQVTAERQTSSNSIVVSYEVYEFSSSWVDAVIACQTESVSVIDVTLLTSGAVTALNTQNAILIYSGPYTTDVLGGLAAVVAYSGEGLIGQVFPKTTSPSSGYRVTFHMVVFNKNVVKQRALRQVKHVGGTGEPDTLTLGTNFTAGKSALFWLGTSASTSTWLSNKYCCIGSFTAPNTLSSNRITDTDNCNQSLELIEFY